jgi:hypothetical protein
MAEPDNAKAAVNAYNDLFRVHFVVIVLSALADCDFCAVCGPGYHLYIKTA